MSTGEGSNEAAEDEEVEPVGGQGHHALRHRHTCEHKEWHDLSSDEVAKEPADKRPGDYTAALSVPDVLIQHCIRFPGHPLQQQQHVDVTDVDQGLQHHW